MQLRNWKHLDKLNALVLATGCTLWLQYAFFSKFFPDVNPIPYDINSFLLFFMFVHAFLLLIPSVLFFWKRKWCYQHHWQLAIIILAPQILPAAFKLATYSKPNYDFYDYQICEENKFTFASEENIIILVVDAMGEHIFREVWKQYPEVQQSFKDFTCFDRIISPLPSTSYAVPAMLTGVNFEGDYRLAEPTQHAKYLKQASNSENSLFLNFKKLGFHTDAYPFILQTISYCPTLLDNVAHRDEHQQSAHLLLDGVFFRLLPGFLKPLLGNSYLQLTDPFVKAQGTDPDDKNMPYDRIFYNKLKNTAKTGSFSKGLKYLHLQGAHAFIRVNENLEYNFNTDYIRQLRGSLRNLELLIEKLKELNIYDQTLLVVSGDHSEQYTPETVSLIKRPGETHEQMQFNSLPCQISDLPLTVLAEKKLRPSEMSIFSHAPVPSTGETRDSNLPSYFPIGNWKKNFERLDLDPQNLTLNEMPFSSVKNQMHILVNKNLPLPYTVFFLAKDLHSGERWESEHSTPNPDECLPTFYQLSLTGIPDGDYMICQRKKIKKNDMHEEEYLESSYFPEFLLLRNGMPSFSKNYPGLTPRPLRINEKIVFDAMQPYPQLELPEQSVPTRHYLCLIENEIMGIYLPQSNTPLALQFKMKIMLQNSMTLELFHEGILLHSQTLSPENMKLLSFEFVLPDELSNLSKLNLQFRLVRKRQNRERDYLHKINITSLQLMEAKQ